VLSKNDGSPNAPIAFLLEAYGHWETVYERPLVGASYTDKCLPWWNEVGLDRKRDVWISNTWDQGQPPKRIDDIDEQEMRAAMQRARDRIDALPGPDGRGPRVIVAGGNYALYTLTGNGVVSFHHHDGRHKRPGIMDWRGSILRYQTNDGRTIKVIPTPHPAAVFRKPALEWVCKKDWQRIAEDKEFYDLRLPQRTRMIAPSKAELIEWLRWTRGEAVKRAKGAKYFERVACSLDVETPNKIEYEMRQKASQSEAPTVKCRTCGHTRRWHGDTESASIGAEALTHAITGCAGLRGKGGCECAGFLAPLGKPRKIKVSEEAYLGCVGWSWDPKLALCAPTTLEYWQDPAVFAVVMAEIAAFHADPNIDFGGQNQPFDAWWCAMEKIPFRIGWDLMKMHRCQRPWSEWNDLAFQASIDTREPFWKHEAKLPDEISRWSHNKEQLWSYNDTDNCVQRELLDRRLEALQDAGRFEYYEEIEASDDHGRAGIDNELLALSLWGMRADEEGRAVHFDRCNAEAVEIGKQINAAADMKIVAKVAVSPPAMKKFLYDKLRLPVQYVKNAKKEKVVSTDVVTLKRLMEQFPTLEVLQTVGKLALRHRRLMVEKNFVKASAVDKDGRIRGQFRQDTSLGRTKCSKTPKDKGRNLQNIDRTLRKFFLADTGDEVVSI
jgi:uracil-DNA glycosylase family 4